MLKYMVWWSCWKDFQLRSQVAVKEIFGDVAQLGEHCLRKAGVEGSNPFISTNYRVLREFRGTLFT